MPDTRVSQVGVEVFEGGSAPTAVSQVGVEVFKGGSPSTVTSQVGIELFFPPTIGPGEDPNPAFPAGTRISQVVTEYVTRPVIPARTSQVVVEYAASPPVVVRMTQFIIEYIKGTHTPPPPGGCPDVVDLPTPPKPLVECPTIIDLID